MIWSYIENHRTGSVAQAVEHLLCKPEANTCFTTHTHTKANRKNRYNLGRGALLEEGMKEIKVTVYGRWTSYTSW
jgi:DNA-binding LacI/PurR family transcriptional regulator